MELIDEAIPHIQGKSTRKSPNYAHEIEGRAPDEKKTGIHADLMFLKPLKVIGESKEPEKINFIISVSDFGLTILKAITSKGLGEVSNGVADILRIYKHHGWTLTSFRSDGEYNFENALNLLVNAPPHVPRGSGSHDGRIEERVRRIKENVRAIQCLLPYHLGRPMLTWACYYATYVLNLMPKKLGDGISPREMLTGVKPNFKKCLPVAFGDFCQVLERDTNNTLKPRTVPALALLPTGNGPVKFASLFTGKTITREQFKIIYNVPYELLAIVKTMQERGVLAIEELLKPVAPANVNEEIELIQLTDTDDEGVQVNGHDVDDLPPLVAHDDKNLAHGDGEAVGTNDGSLEDNDEDASEEEDDADGTQGIDLNESEVMVTEAVPVDTNCMTISQAYSLYPADLVNEAMERELTNMIEKEVFGFVSIGDKKKIPRKMIVPSKCFTKDKGLGNRVELKGRFVGGGHRQDESTYERKSSPTASPSVIFITLADAGNKMKDTLVMDVPCAYLHASRGDLPKVYVRLSKKMADIFVKMNPEYAMCQEEDRMLLVEILKGLYGLVESGYTWYHHLVSFLQSLGFLLCENDPCVMKMRDVTLVIYVDDLLLTGDGETLNQICDMIEKEFGDCKRKMGKSFSFIGMDFEIKDGGVGVKINLDKLLETTEGTADTPCPNHILPFLGMQKS